MENNKILVVEDNPVNQQLLSIILNKLEIESDIVSSGNEAVELVGKTTYSLIMTDLHMPGLDGFATAEKIHALDETLPVIAITADDSSDTIKKCKKYNITDIIGKPFTKDKVLEFVNKYSRKS